MSAFATCAASLSLDPISWDSFESLGSCLYAVVAHDGWWAGPAARAAPQSCLDPRRPRSAANEHDACIKTHGCTLWRPWCDYSELLRAPRPSIGGRTSKFPPLICNIGTFFSATANEETMTRPRRVHTDRRDRSIRSRKPTRGHCVGGDGNCLRLEAPSLRQGTCLFTDDRNDKPLVARMVFDFEHRSVRL